jgi:hypothetical protein
MVNTTLSLSSNEPGVPLTTASPCAPVPPITTIFSMMEEDMLKWVLVFALVLTVGGWWRNDE